MTNPIVCTKCKKFIKTPEFVKCCLCLNTYDIECVGISPVRYYNTFDMEKKNAWKCPKGCPDTKQLSKPIKPKTPKRFLASESDQAEQISSPVISNAKVTKRPASSTIPKQANQTFDVDSPIDTKEHITEERFKFILKNEMSHLNAQATSVSAHLKSMDEKFNCFQEALSFINSQFEDLKTKLCEKDAAVEALQKRNAILEVTVSDLSNRLNLAEQHMRECNLEINGLPEHRSENLSKTVFQLARIVKCDIDDKDILHATRVAKINKDNNAPRSVVAKLYSPRVRDTLLAAVTKFNKENSKDKLSSEHLGIGGRRVPVFVSEHLTPSNKYLHAAARLKAKELAYKFVWVRNGRVFIRKDETSQAHIVRNMEYLNSLN